MRLNSLLSIRNALAVLIIFGLCLLVACTPLSVLFPQPSSVPLATPTPFDCKPILITTTSSLTSIHLPDTSEIILAENTEIELIVAGNCPEITEHHILLHQGQVAIQSHLPVGSWFKVSNLAGFIVQLNDTGAVSFDPNSNRFLLDCTNGNCAMGPNAQQLTQLGCDESGGLDQNGVFGGPFPVDAGTLKVKYGDWIVPQCLPPQTDTPTPLSSSTMTPTITETPTRTITATGTPTPTNTPNRAATATAYCRMFLNQFPGTPCP